MIGAPLHLYPRSSGHAYSTIEVFMALPRSAGLNRHCLTSCTMPSQSRTLGYSGKATIQASHTLHTSWASSQEYPSYRFAKQWKKNALITLGLLGAYLAILFVISLFFGSQTGTPILGMLGL